MVLWFDVWDGEGIGRGLEGEYDVSCEVGKDRNFLVGVTWFGRTA